MCAGGPAFNQFQPFRIWRSQSAATKKNDGSNYICIRKLKQVKAAVLAGGTVLGNSIFDLTSQINKTLKRLVLHQRTCSEPQVCCGEFIITLRMQA